MAERVREGGTPVVASGDVRPGRRPWWRTRRGWVLAALLVAFTAQMAWTAARTQLDDERVAMVSLRAGTTAEQRQEVRETCSDVPGVSLVEDVGRPDLAERFPARFSLSGATLDQEAALVRCLDQFADRVVSYQVEGRA